MGIKILKSFFLLIFICLSAASFYFTFKGGELSIIGAYFLWIIDPVFLLPIGYLLAPFPKGNPLDAVFVFANIVMGYLTWFKLLPLAIRRLNLKKSSNNE